MSRLVRVVTAFAVVPVFVAAVILGLALVTYISSDLLFAALALPTAAVSYWLLSSAGLPSGSAASGAFLVTALSYVAVLAIAIEYLVN